MLQAFGTDWSVCNLIVNSVMHKNDISFDRKKNEEN